ncbi:radical SAM/SPASM domain-containing protein [Planctomycetota bacterium]
MPVAKTDISWIDEYILNVSEAIFVRETDNLLIKLPNQAFKLNMAGIRLLKRLLAGEKITEITKEYGGSESVRRDIHIFFMDLRRLLKSGIDDLYESPAVEKRPFELGFCRKPVLSEVAVTYRCNIKCRFCYAGCNCTANPAGDDYEMSRDEIFTVLDHIKEDAEVPSVSFTGGEATLRRDLPELVAHARSLEMRVNLITNGTAVTRELAAELVDEGLHSAQVSVEASTPEVHDNITQVKGSHQRSIAGLKHFINAGIHVHPHATICGLNRNDLANYPTMVRALGLDKFSMNIIIPTGSALMHENLVLTYTEIGVVLESIIAESEKQGIEFMWYSPTPMCMFNPIVHGLGNKGCSACDGLISVGSNGCVLPCASYDEPVGNILSQPFEEIWDSPQAAAFRDKFLAHDVCKRCDNFHICNGACPLYWRSMGFGELERIHNCNTGKLEITSGTVSTTP